uniref:Transducin/WD40 repeat-like superfamily protein n=1 Tax=Aplanochytrium stocchinoi TaxID=215587 RepID=A0A7S3PMT1_9STRA|mmetsp:Transcript_8375/g.10924  ORF Transcript_8375/g.10924 Transcript_8375/m.10924 type:complete len:521 (+) Transcript_8375:522-2084(+)
MSSAYVPTIGTTTGSSTDCQHQVSEIKGKLKRKLSYDTETTGKPCFAQKRRRSSHIGTKCQKYNSHLVRKLLSRQMDSRGYRIFNKHARSHERFRNFSLVSKLDSHFPDNTSDLFKLCFLRKRSKVVEIVSAKDIVFGLTQTGVCTAFDRLTSERICFLNIEPDEVIRSLFYNKSNDSLITVSVYRADNYSSLKCRSTSLEYIRRNKPNMGFNLFETESLRWPGFVEFDDVNGKVLTYSATNKVYKVWDLVNYNLLYAIVDAGIQEIKISPGIMLLIYNRSDVGNSTTNEECVVPLKILAIGSGETLKSFNHKIKPHKKIDFIEQFNEKLLVKQENENLEIVDVRTASIHCVDSTHFMTPSAFIFLYENQLFLTFRDHMVSVWNFKGELVTTFEDHMLWHPDCNTNNIYITSQQDLIISYCKNKKQKSNFGQHRNRVLSSSSEDGSDHNDEHDEVSSKGSLNISDIFTGKCLAKIVAKRSQSNYQEQLRALDDVTALYYNEELNEIYTGNKLGVVHCWSN